MFYEYLQNNSGGRFDEDLGHLVVIEARDATDADHRAEDIGLYFDGCRKGRDCSCCGDRWHRAYEGAETFDLEDIDTFYYPVQVYYLDGKVKRFGNW